MNVTHQTLAALVRGVCIASVSVTLAAPIRSLLAVAKRRMHRVAWTTLLAPYLTPVLLVGYAYSGWALSLIRAPGWLAFFYATVLLFRLTPIAALVLYFAPSPLSVEAVHCHALVAGRSRWRRLLFHLRGGGRAPLLAFALVLLLAFGEFELASIWGIKTWTVALFDGQAGGLPVTESLRLAAAPLICEAVVLFGAVALLARGGWFSSSPAHQRPPARMTNGQRWAAAYLVVAALAGTAFPLLFVLGHAMPGFVPLVQNFALAREIGTSLLTGLTAGCGVYAAAAALAKRPIPAFVVAGVGLLGPLIVSLLIIAFFQAPPFQTVYNTPAPLLVALALVLFPMALLLRGVLASTREGDALHLARLVRSGPLLWDLSARRHFWVAYLLFCWGYYDLTVSAMTAPVGMTPVTVRLYNLMHYGQTAVLSAMICAAFAVPVVFLLLTPVARSVYASLNGNR